MTPLHWGPGNAFTTHVINVLHLLLRGREVVLRRVPPGAPPHRRGGSREEAKGFIGQEEAHSRAHSLVLDHLAVQGLDTAGYTARIDWMFERLLGDHGLGERLGPRWLRRQWLATRLAIVAVIEHFTCVLGCWVLYESAALDDAAADPPMLDLLRWHGAEEVEHRAVAFELYLSFGGGDLRWVVVMAESGS